LPAGILDLAYYSHSIEELYFIPAKQQVTLEKMTFVTTLQR